MPIARNMPNCSERDCIDSIQYIKNPVVHKSNTTMKPTVSMPLVPWNIGSFFFSTNASDVSAKLVISILCSAM